MDPLQYLKAVVSGVGANVFPPIFAWLVSIIPGIDQAPAPVQSAIVILLVALATGGAVYATPNAAKK